MQQFKNRFVLEVDPCTFSHELEELRRQLKKEGTEQLIEQLSEITIDLQSYLLHWNLQSQNNKEHFISNEQRDREVEKNYSLFKEMGYDELVSSIKTEVLDIHACNLHRLSRLSDEGLTNNRWGNNDAGGLKQAMRRGVVLVTTNPQIINILRKRFAPYWGEVKHKMKTSFPHFTAEQIAAKITTEIVLESARLLRAVYNSGENGLGYVSLQLNPHLSDNPTAMIQEAIMIYNWLQEEFAGQEPNVLFKVPGTYAGLAVTKELTQKGIGVNVTVNYSVAQQLAFGKIIEQGKAAHCYLTQMNRRLEAPVALELEEGECDNPKKVSSWSSVAVIRRAYELLYQKNKYQKSILLGASISKPWHVQRSIAGGKDVPLHQTITPEEVKKFDSGLTHLIPSIRDKIGEEIMRKLMESETFRKAYDPALLPPREFDHYKPTQTTLEGFKEHYREFINWCQE